MQNFHGGDSLKGIKALYHQMMIQNMSHIEHPYHITKHQNHLILGATQLKIITDTKANDLLIDIVTHACGRNGKPYLTKSEVEMVSAQLSHSSLRDDSFGGLLPKINAALSSEYGMDTINTQYSTSIRILSQKIDNIIGFIRSPIAQKFYASELGKLCLFDYALQDPIIKNSFFKNLKDADESMTLEDHISYILNQASTSNDIYQSAKQRVVNILEIYNNYSEQADVLYIPTFNKMNHNVTIIPIEKHGQMMKVTHNSANNKINLQVGNPKDNNIKVTCEKFSLSTSLNINLKELNYLKIGANFDDHAMIKVNNQSLYHSTKGGEVLEIHPKSYTHITTSNDPHNMIQCDTNRNWKYDMIDVTDQLINGTNTITMDFIVGGYGEGVLNIEFQPLQYQEQYPFSTLGDDII